jgi:hypothetical protein
MPAKKTLTLNKSDFIRSLSADLSVAQVIEKAKESGISITPSHVYKARGRAAGTARGAKKAKTNGAMKAVNGAPTTTQPRVAKPAAANGRGLATPPSSKSEDLLRAVAAEIGLRRAIEVLQGERSRVTAIIGQ